MACHPMRSPHTRTWNHYVNPARDSSKETPYNRSVGIDGSFRDAVPSERSVYSTCELTAVAGVPTHNLTVKSLLDTRLRRYQG